MITLSKNKWLNIGRYLDYTLYLTDWLLLELFFLLYSRAVISYFSLLIYLSHFFEFIVLTIISLIFFFYIGAIFFIYAVQ